MRLSVTGGQRSFGRMPMRHPRSALLGAVLALVAVLAVGVLALFRIAQALNDRNA